MTVGLTRKELGAVELRRAAGRCRDARAACRMLALALVLEGGSREAAARAAGMDRQTLRDWGDRYKGEGPRGPRAWTGRPCVTGCTATTRRASPASATVPGPGAGRASPRSKGPSWRR